MKFPPPFEEEGLRCPWRPWKVCGLGSINLEGVPTGCTYCRFSIISPRFNTSLQPLNSTLPRQPLCFSGLPRLMKHWGVKRVPVCYWLNTEHRELETDQASGSFLLVFCSVVQGSVDCTVWDVQPYDLWRLKLTVLSIWKYIACSKLTCAHTHTLHVTVRCFNTCTRHTVSQIHIRTHIQKQMLHNSECSDLFSFTVFHFVDPVQTLLPSCRHHQTSSTCAGEQRKGWELVPP